MYGINRSNSILRLPAYINAVYLHNGHLFLLILQLYVCVKLLLQSKSIKCIIQNVITNLIYVSVYFIFF